MKYSKNHEWIEFSKEQAKVGLTNYGREMLGEIVFVDLPKVGESIRAYEEVAVILESSKAATEIYSPLTGKILQVNEKLKKNPELINEKPESEGWLFVIKFYHKKELDQLMDPIEYNVYVKQ